MVGASLAPSRSAALPSCRGPEFKVACKDQAQGQGWSCEKDKLVVTQSQGAGTTIKSKSTWLGEKARASSFQKQLHPACQVASSHTVVIPLGEAWETHYEAPFWLAVSSADV